MAPILAKSLNRLSKESVIEIALQWLTENPTSAPYLLCNRTGFEADEEDYLHTPAESVEKLRKLYRGLQKESAQATKRDVIDRIVDGDWRRGISLHQHATLDFAHLEQNDTALKWSALKLVPLVPESQNMAEFNISQPKKRRKFHHNPTATYPDISPAVFVSALKAEISPLVKAHYHLYRMPAPYNLTILRLYISPNSAFAPTRSRIPRQAKAATDNARIMYIALPDSCPYVYISISGSSCSSTASRNQSKGSSARDAKAQVSTKVDITAMKRIILEAIPKAFSRPQQRWALEPTKLVAKSLKTMCELRGNQKPGTGGGAYSVFAMSGEKACDASPVDVQVPRRGPDPQEDGRAIQITKRFGHLNGDHYAALDRLHVKLRNVLPPSDPLEAEEQNEDDDSRISIDNNDESRDILLSFSGSDVFGGLKKLAQLDGRHIDLDRMPSWMTGELGASYVVA